MLSGNDGDQMRNSLLATVLMMATFGLRLVALAAATPFVGISQARIDNQGGMPRMLINEQPVLPIIFWFNIETSTNYLKLHQHPQVKLAVQAGIHIYGLLIHFPRASDGINIDFTAAEKYLDTFIQVDPQAVFFLRAFPWPTPQWKDWKAIAPDEMMVFDDGTTIAPHISIASDYFARSFREETTRIVSHFESSRFANRMLGYHLGGPEFEMFPPGYTEKGPDYSLASQRLFRKWLAGKYKTDGVLGKAWGNPKATLAQAGIPRPEKGRFPMRSTGDGSPIKVFYNIPGEQDWVDYSDYYSDLVASRVIDWARTVKQASGGRKLNMFCQGYVFEIGGSFSGHYALDKVLSCPEVDVLMSPVSYAVRQLGEPAGFMSPVDSISARGKLWLSEDDTRTAFIELKDAPAWYRAWFQPPITPQPYDKLARDLHDTQAMLERNLGMTFAHRAGIWWCDLPGAGAFQHPALWQMLEERKKIYQNIYDRPNPYRPEVAVIVDERSRLSVRSDWDMFSRSLGMLRNQCDLSGTAIGYYLLDDFISGVVPPCKVHLFPNAFQLSDAQIKAIRGRLEREGATAIWNYAAGYLGPNGPDPLRMEALTGIKIAADDGPATSQGAGMLAGESLGSMNFKPRFVVADKTAEPLGHYHGDGAVSSASKQVGKMRSLYLGEVGVSAAALGRLFKSAGVNLWTDDGSVVVTDGRFLMIHSGQAGLKPIAVPKGVRIKPITGKIERREGGTIYVNFEKGDTFWFSLSW
jgi:beta-galactosidase